MLDRRDQGAEPAPQEPGSGENRPRAGSLEIDLDLGSAAATPEPGATESSSEKSDSGINRLLKRFGIK